MPADLFFARHGDTRLNQAGRFRSWMNPPLNAEGRRDALRLAEYFSDTDLGSVITSPLLRTFETGQTIARQTGASLTTSGLWRPWHLGDWAGQQSAPLIPAMLDRIQTNEPPPNGERFSTFRDRVTQGLQQAQEKARRADNDVAVVTHVRNIRLVLDLLAHPHPTTMQLENIMDKDDPVAPGGIIRLTHDADGRWHALTIPVSQEDQAMHAAYYAR